jgi:uncharacterized membrane protein YhaH (DUF805 family)
MKVKLSDLWRWDGTIGRGEYFLWGVLLFAVKFNLDRLLGWEWFHMPLTLFDREQARLYLWQSLPSKAEAPYLLTLLAVSLPFLWAGVVLTLRRLRALGWQPWWVALFFVPLLKLVFFAALCLLPSRDEAPGPSRERSGRGWLGALIPRSATGSALVALLFSLATAATSVWLGTAVLRNYGWALFVGLPFLTPLLAVLLYSLHERRSLRACLGLANGVIALAGAGFLLFAMEGVICLIMAAPLAFAVGSAAGAVGYFIQKTFWWPEDSTRLFCVALLAVPLAMAVEHALPPPLPLLEVKSSVIVDAPPETVWRNVVTFSELPPPRELIFRLGVAYPVRATIYGQGVGAVRHCNFSTGPFVEPIQIWDEPRLLKFSVTHNPEPMQEWTPYRHVHPAHLDGYLESKGGQFRLVPLQDGRTLLEGTTWYHHRLWPAPYWQAWSDLIIHRIHLRVLNHVKQLSEGGDA